MFESTEKGLKRTIYICFVPFFLCACLVAVAGLYSCNKPGRHIRPAFYYWKTVFQLSKTEQRTLDSLGCNTLYVKFSDIGKTADGGIRPQALLELRDTSGLGQRRIVPAVFITNAVFQGIDAEQIRWLAQQTARSLARIGAQFPGRHFDEIQFDCDWTPGTRAAYFSFLQEIKKRLPAPVSLSATIRLHQYKFPDKTGVPPVERGMLMFYNTGELTSWEESNSIFTTASAEKYVYGAPDNYPLPLDIALPLFSWGVVFREGVFYKLINELGEEQLLDSIRFASLGARRYEVKTGTFLEGHYLRPGDHIRLERIDPPALRAAAQLASGLDLDRQAVAAFYHLDSGLVRRYPVHLLHSVCDTLISARPPRF